MWTFVSSSRAQVTAALCQVRADDPHLPVTRLVAVENTHNKCGGVALPLPWLQQLGHTCSRLGLKLHCDGGKLLSRYADISTI